MMKKSAPEASHPSTGEIMNVWQAAEYLHCHPSTLYRLLDRRKFPGFRLGADWRFRRADIDTWIAAQEIRVSSEENKADRQQRAQQPARTKKPGQRRKS